ncbi:hypothetical protein HA466_0048320 [Hirschfeldia incana]|nr:hypothetical protein HA466_0048320 [Hirschfeldia incana]
MATLRGFMTQTLRQKVKKKKKNELILVNRFLGMNLYGEVQATLCVSPLPISFLVSVSIQSQRTTILFPTHLLHAPPHEYQSENSSTNRSIFKFASVERDRASSLDYGGERSSFVAGLIENRAKEVRTAFSVVAILAELRFDSSLLRVSTIAH